MKILPVVVLGGIGAYLLWRVSPDVQAFAAQNLGVTPLPSNPYLLRQTNLAPGNAPLVSAPTFAPGNPVPGAITSVGGAALIGAVGPGSALIGAATAGIGAGVAVLTWAIVEKGLFRGGEEGVKTNPARDEYFQQFINWCAANVRGWSYGTSSSAQQPAAATVLNMVTDGNTANRLIAGVYDAHTIDEYVAAAKAMATTLQPWATQYGVRIVIPT